MAEGKERSGPGTTVTAAAGTGAVTWFAGFTMDPEKGLKLIDMLSKQVGPVGFVALLCTVPVICAAVAALVLMWNRLKEKDQECQAEHSRQREAWKAVVDGKDEDNKEIAKTVTNLLVQVTLLAERARPTNVPTRSRP